MDREGCPPGQRDSHKFPRDSGKAAAQGWTIEKLLLEMGFQMSRHVAYKVVLFSLLGQSQIFPSLSAVFQDSQPLQD